MEDQKILQNNISTAPSSIDSIKDEEYGRNRLLNSPFTKIIQDEEENASNQYIDRSTD